MPRTIPSCPSKPVARSGYETRTYEVELITPLFGGGVETRTVDVSMPIRATSLRGQLQFWWRATVGANYTDKTQLREAQDRVWGSTEKASPVEVVIGKTNVDGPPRPCGTVERGPDGRFRSMQRWEPELAPVNYTLFPFQAQLADGRTRIEVEPAKFLANVRFQLVIRWRKDVIDFNQDLLPALKAWANFGGVGSRTRRGVGAVFIKELAVQDESELAALLKGKPSPQLWPTLPGGRVLIGPDAKDAMEAWEDSIKLLRDFRQGVGVGRNPGQQHNRPGRSRWPEPDTIRRVTRRHSPQHPPSQKPDAFPRAEFGLPIVFHFKDTNAGDPQDTTLYPVGEDRERMASPLVLRPIKFAGGSFVGLILKLVTPPLDGVELCGGANGDRIGPPFGANAIRNPQLANYTNSPMQRRCNNGSAVDAFLKFATEHGFQEFKP